MKGIIVVSFILLAGLASAYTPEQQTALDGMNLSFKLGIAYERASHGQNVTEFNALVNEYNAWILQHFGGDATLCKPRMNESLNVTAITKIGNQYYTKPFSASSDLSKFGKQQVYAVNPTNGGEDDVSRQNLRNL
ncbi:MAG: hypothetical protein GYA39_04215 [Methanothrix sp.]|nr:hypothetical protein [Methanothrix sp.]